MINNTQDFDSQVLLETQSLTASSAEIQSTAVDLIGFKGSAFTLGLTDFTAGTLSIKFLESDDNAVFTESEEYFISPNSLGGNMVIVGLSQNGKRVNIGYSGHKQYVKMSITPANATVDLTLTVTLSGRLVQIPIEANELEAN